MAEGGGQLAPAPPPPEPVAEGVGQLPPTPPALGQTTLASPHAEPVAERVGLSEEVKKRLAEEVMQRLLCGFQHVESEMFEGSAPAMPAGQWAARIMWGVAQQMGYVAPEPGMDGAATAQFADWAYGGAPPPIPAPAPNPEPEAEGSASPSRVQAPRQLLPEQTRIEIALVKAAVDEWEQGGRQGPRPEWAAVMQKEAARKQAEEQLDSERVHRWLVACQARSTSLSYEEWKEAEAVLGPGARVRGHTSGAEAQAPEPMAEE